MEYCQRAKVMLSLSILNTRLNQAMIKKHEIKREVDLVDNLQGQGPLANTQRSSPRFTSHSPSTFNKSIMALFNPRRTVVLLIAVAIAGVYAQKHAASIASMSVLEIEENLQVRITSHDTTSANQTNISRNAPSSKTSIDTSLQPLLKLPLSPAEFSTSSSQALLL